MNNLKRWALPLLVASLFLWTLSALSSSSSIFPVESPPTNVERNPQGFFDLETGGPWHITNESVTAAIGVRGENNQHVHKAEITNSRFVTSSYGVYIGKADSLSIYNSSFTSGPGTDDYSFRGSVRYLTIYGSSFDNTAGSKACFRLYNSFGSNISHTEFSGGSILLGGGAADWNSDPLPCTFGQMSNCQINFLSGSLPDALIIFPETRYWILSDIYITLRAGTRVGTIWDGATDIVFRNVWVRYVGEQNYRPLQWSDFKDGWLLELQSPMRNIRIEY